MNIGHLLELADKVSALNVGGTFAEEREERLRFGAEFAKAQGEIDRLEKALVGALAALRHQRDALVIVRDRQGGHASAADLNQGIAQIDAALRAGER
jgi:hypothetical protein